MLILQISDHTSDPPGVSPDMDYVVTAPDCAGGQCQYVNTKDTIWDIYWTMDSNQETETGR